MTQSVELILDRDSEAAVVAQWQVLSDAGLASSVRSTPSPDHRPHITLYAAEAIPVQADERLPTICSGLDLRLRIGGLLVFGPRRERCVLARQVVASAELLDLQAAIADACGAMASDHFAPGGWTPHVTLAPRMPTDQLSAAASALESSLTDLEVVVRGCRRWDGDRRVSWSLVTGE